jgi:hypothetical protein
MKEEGSQFMLFYDTQIKHTLMRSNLQAKSRDNFSIPGNGEYAI